MTFFTFQNRTRRNERGYSIVEVLLYVALFTVLSTVLISTLFGMTQTYKESLSVNDLIDSSQLSMERMAREIRNASDIDMPASVFGDDPGILKLISTTADDTPKTVTFDTTGSHALRLDDSSIGDPSLLTGSRIGVTSLVFRPITTAHGKAVRIEMKLAALRSPSGKTATYTDTVALRGAY